MVDKVDKMVEFYDDSLIRVNRINMRMKKVMDDEEKMTCRLASLNHNLDSQKEDMDNVMTSVITVLEAIDKFKKEKSLVKMITHYNESLNMIKDCFGKARRNSLKYKAGRGGIQQENGPD